MADPPATPAQGPPPFADGQRAAPPAFAPPVANQFLSPPPQPVTPSPPPPLSTFQSSSSCVGSSSQERHLSSAVLQAESDYFAATSPGPAKIQESSNQAYSNGSTEEQRMDAEQRSDGKSYSSHYGLSNGVGINNNFPLPVPGSSVLAVPMGPPPPPPSHFTQAPHFASPLRPIPLFNAVASPGRGNTFL